MKSLTISIVFLQQYFALGSIQYSAGYSMLVTLYKISEVHFRWLGRNGFHVKAKNERLNFTLILRCRIVVRTDSRQNFQISRRRGRLRQNIAPESVLHVQHDYFSPFNQSNH